MIWLLVALCWIISFLFAGIEAGLLALDPVRLRHRAVVRLSRMLELAMNLLRPLHVIGEFVERVVFARAENLPRLFAGREELKLIAIQSEQSGALSSTERAMIHNVVDFTSVKVRDVMVPLTKTLSFRPDDSPAEVLQTSEKSGIDRFPVLGGDAEPLGLINVFD